jgi:type VI protein secretion system component Hcp
MRRIRSKLSYANVVATICLFITLGGTSYAAVKITGADIKPESVTGANIKDGSLLAKDFKKGQLPGGKPGAPGAPGQAGAQGGQGAAGAQGAPGAAGAQGPQGEPGEAAAPPPGGPATTERLTIAASPSPIVVNVLSSSLDGVFEEGAPKAAFEGLEVTATPGADAPQLLAAVASGKHLASAKLEVTVPGAASPTATLELGEMTVASFAVSGSGEERTEQMRLTVPSPGGSQTEPPRLVWAAGAPALPAPGQKVGEMTLAGVSGTINLISDPTAAVEPEGWGLVGPELTGGGGGGAGRAKFETFRVVKAVDSRSPELLDAMRFGKHFTLATIKVFVPGTTTPATTYELKDASFGGYHLRGGPVPIEELALNYSAIKQTVPVAGGEPKVGCWSPQENKAC